MPMTPFVETAGPRAFAEMQRVFVPRGGTLPPGPYSFIEWFCNEPDCDCRRVVIHIVRPDDLETVLATLTVNWKSSSRAESVSVALVPSGTQTTHSPTLLKLFRGIVKSDPDYVERLRRHYTEARNSPAQAVGHRAVAKTPDRHLRRSFRREGYTLLLDPDGLEVLVDEYHPQPLKLSWAAIDQLRRDALRSRRPSDTTLE